MNILGGFILSLLLGGALFVVIRYGLPTLMAWYEEKLKITRAYLNTNLSELFIFDVSLLLAHLVVWRVPVTAVLIYLLTSSLLFSAGFCVLAYFAPEWIFAYMKRQRFDKFDEQLVDAVNVLSSSVRAGQTLIQAMEAVADKMPAPASEEFGLLLKEHRLVATPIDRVLENARTRLNRPNFSLVATAIIVNREKGGNLVEVLDKISTSVREIFRLEKKVKTETASVRFSAKLMAAMPLVIGIIFYFIEPSSMELLFTDPVGTIVLFVVLLLNVIALVVIRRIVNVEV